MKIQKIKNRSVLFTKTQPAGWDLSVQLIMGNKYNYLIDTGLGSSFIEPVKEYIKNETKPLIVINTHYHWDHIWGNGSFRDCTIISHKLCREMMESNWDEMIQKYSKHMVGEAELVLPTITFDSELYFPEDQIRLVYTPGHTIDSISVIDELEKIIHVGDNIGDTLDELLPSLAVSKEDYRKTLLQYQAMDFDTCLSGHNIVLDKQVIEQILNLL
ncbi:MBL fold metallo-hydrolase [Paenibacillus albiflavus]|uniref:MBL fold metallo-hydrolase n=1 Tax=Paenibacillus albiflavus TaxID=2545760 RepID=A0A4R4ENF1_9BACL|nr:MBL fold metallo-hydrolase [Paenibacillus albiflavus]TCZ80051.1 MBL fold metallo-hydrolase [Paenibacillus albiflavus]